VLVIVREIALWKGFHMQLMNILVPVLRCVSADTIEFLFVVEDKPGVFEEMIRNVTK